MNGERVKKMVRESYGKIVSRGSSCCGPAKSVCGGTDPATDTSRKIGYTDKDLGTVPEGANLGLGCGNPVALATLREGETVLDLGSGAGFDCFLASKRVGDRGRVIGVDMTPEMVDKARENVRKGDYRNVEFRLGEIENLPVADSTADAVISNCVINLSPDKEKVFQEAFRVLKPDGRLMVSDIVLLKELPDPIKESAEAYVGCVSGAIGRDEYLRAIEAAGFEKVEVLDETSFPIEFILNDPLAKSVIEKSKIPRDKLKEADRAIASITICGSKPSRAGG
ncbi:MAG: arsenite methyltransferase [Proteobacteria bacterium]|nr:arsenite methyltransferase [Pseudomonadota bacterium]